MLLPQIQEREYRFKLALRIGLPIFALVFAFISHTLIQNYTTLQSSFYIEAIIILVFCIYFILYLIYKGFDVQITDHVTKTFTREYFYKYLDKELKNQKEYTLIIISIDNLRDINTQYGMENGDKVLESVALWIVAYLENRKIEKFPIGRIKGGDFIIGLEGLKSQYNAIFELMCLQNSEFKVGDIEVKISTGLTDTSYSNKINYMIENIFEMQEKKRNSKKIYEEKINPNELESLVIKAMNQRDLIVMTQDIYEDEKVAFKECYIKLKTQEGKTLYPKTYLKVINKLGLGVQYDLMILEELLLNCIKDEKTIYALNISPSSLRNDKFLSSAKEMLNNSNKKIMFILSEQEYFSYTSRYKSIISSLKKYGVLITIDRLGSIHSSFLYLRELDIDCIRFDSYYSNEVKLTQSSSIIKGFIVMAKEKNMKTWIKNIESLESYTIAKEMKIDYIQGKYLSNLEKNYES